METVSIVVIVIGSVVAFLVFIVMALYYLRHTGHNNGPKRDEYSSLEARPISNPAIWGTSVSGIQRREHVGPRQTDWVTPDSPRVFGKRTASEELVAARDRNDPNKNSFLRDLLGQEI